MKTASRGSSIPAAMALNMIALMGALPVAKKHPQNFLLKRLFEQHAPVSQIKVDSRLSIEAHDSPWFANYE